MKWISFRGFSRKTKGTSSRWQWGRNLATKWDDFHIPIVNFPSHVSTFHLHLHMEYSRVCRSYQAFLKRELMLSRKLLNQGFLAVKMKSSLGFVLGIFVSEMTTNMFHLSTAQYCPRFLFLILLPDVQQEQHDGCH